MNLFKSKKSILLIVLSIFVIASIFTFFIPKKKIHPCTTQIESYNQILPCIESWDKDSYIFFDIDKTIYTSTDFTPRSLRYPLDFKIKALIAYPSLIYNDVYDKALSLMFTKAKYMAIEPIIPQLINKLKEKGCTVLVLTATTTGSYGVIKDMEEQRYQDLKNLGMTFSDKYPRTIFKTLPKFRGNYPSIYKGMIFCNEEPKGKALGAFLDYFNVKPSKIIFFDDHMYNIDSVNNECIKRNIPYHSYHYLGAKKLPGSWNTKHALLQLDYLMKEERWISDQEASWLLETKGKEIVK